MALEWADEARCREIEPRIGPRVVAGVFSASEGGVSNQAVALALERAAIALGADVRQRAGARSFERRGGRVTGVRAADGTTYRGEAVVFAAGARSGQLAARLGVALPVRPMRGQMIALGGMRAPIQHVVWGPNGYLVPRVNGLVFAGATVEDVGFRRRTTAAGMRRLRAMAGALVPQLRAATEHFSWAGLRPGSADGLPMIGRLSGCDNVYAATAHFRNGILLGPLTGRIVAEALVSADWSAIPAAFDPARFTADAVPARPRQRARAAT
jgi:glycine oxidase